MGGRRVLACSTARRYQHFWYSWNSDCFRAGDGELEEREAGLGVALSLSLSFSHSLSRPLSLSLSLSLSFSLSLSLSLSSSYCSSISAPPRPASFEIYANFTSALPRSRCFSYTVPRSLHCRRPYHPTTARYIHLLSTPLPHPSDISQFHCRFVYSNELRSSKVLRRLRRRSLRCKRFYELKKYELCCTRRLP